MSAGPSPARSRRELVADVLGALSPAQERLQLGRLLTAEQLAVQVYGLAASAPVISPGGRRLARRLGAQERAHAAALIAVTKTAAAAPVPPDPAALQTALAAHGIEVRLASLTTERDWFTLLEGLERVLEGVYYRALGRITNPAHASLAARIMASEAQHSTLLLSYRNPADIQLDVAEGQIKGAAR